MSRRLLCAPCGARYQPGTHELLAASEIEAAEWGRIVKGRARIPTDEQRTMYINDEPIRLTMDTFVCDQCGDLIPPGAPACAETIWLEGRPEPPRWEGEFLA